VTFYFRVIIIFNVIGNLTSSELRTSSFQPEPELRELIAKVQTDYQWGDDILNRSWTELNDMSVIDRDSRDRRTFNAFVDESIEDPAEAWKWRGTRSKARNKGIAMHAQLTANYIYPDFMAQNDDDEEDRGFSEVMQDGVEWMADNSNYKQSFLGVSMGMLVSPVTYMSAEYCEVMQTIKEKTDKGYSKKEILDEVLSGFQAPVYACNQILIANAYDQNVQRHRFNITTEWVEYAEAEAKVGDHENWEFVKPGQESIFNAEDNLFYDVKDQTHTTLVKKTTYKNRGDDFELAFYGGIPMPEADLYGANRIKHRDNRDRPKYNIVPFGYQRIDEHFYFYKSLMNSMYWDNMLYDAQSEMIMNRALLETDMPVAIYGSDKIDTDVSFPGAVITFQDKDTKVQPFLPPANFAAGFNALNATDESMQEASVSDQSAGQVGAASTKATAIAVAEQNAKIMLQGVGKTLAESMVQMGGMMADIFVNNYSTLTIDQLVGDGMKMKYRSFVLPKKNINGKQVSKTLKFDDSLLGADMSEDEVKNEEMKMAIDSGYPDNKSVLIRINPELFARMKFLSRIEPKFMFPKNEEWFQAMLTQLRTTLANDPYISMEALDRELMYAFFRGDGEKFMNKNPQLPDQMGAIPGNTAGAMATGKALGQGMKANTLA
jgi:hypothetical protein